MPKTNLASMSVDALLKLRDDIGVVLNRKAKELESQLARLGHRISASSLLKNLESQAVLSSWLNLPCVFEPDLCIADRLHFRWQ
jgi:hypothetical protein